MDGSAETIYFPGLACTFYCLADVLSYSEDLVRSRAEMRLNVVMGFLITGSNQCFSLGQIPRQFRVSCIAFDRCVVGPSGYCYLESREVPGITCFFASNAVNTSDHLLLEGFGTFPIDVSVVQSGLSRREELQQRRSLGLCKPRYT